MSRCEVALEVLDRACTRRVTPLAGANLAVRPRRRTRDAGFVRPAGLFALGAGINLKTGTPSRPGPSRPIIGAPAGWTRLRRCFHRLFA
jgi:hypothetical protein